MRFLIQNALMLIEKSAHLKGVRIGLKNGSKII